MHPHPLAIEVIGGGGILDEDAFPLEKTARYWRARWTISSITMGSPRGTSISGFSTWRKHKGFFRANSRASSKERTS